MSWLWLLTPKCRLSSSSWQGFVFLACGSVGLEENAGLLTIMRQVLSVDLLLQVVSLLAQGLADQAAATQHPPALRTEAPPKQAADKAQQQAPWFSNLPHINTVRRIGKAGNDGKP